MMVSMISTGRSLLCELDDAILLARLGWGTIWALGSPVKSKALLPLSLSLFVRFHFKPFPGQSLILHGQLKIFSGKFIFYVQPNTRIYGKAVPEVI